jgi:DNA-binding MarR family transcriptional regulator
MSTSRRRAKDVSSAPQAPLDALYSSPEFLIRRAHQLATASFAEACTDLDLTPSQYAVLFALRQHVDVGQNEIGRLVSLDRSTTAMVVRSLRDRGYVQPRADPTDRRKTFLDLTRPGRLVLVQAEKRSERARKALLSVFDAGQADAFLSMLRVLTQVPSAPLAQTDAVSPPST